MVEQVRQNCEAIGISADDPNNLKTSASASKRTRKSVKKLSEEGITTIIDTMNSLKDDMNSTTNFCKLELLSSQFHPGTNVV